MRDDERCTYATVWAASARPSDHKVLTLAVQPIEGWSELWVWRQRAQGRRFEVLRLDTLGTDKTASSVQQLPGFVQWADAGWKRGTVSLR